MRIHTRVTRTVRPFILLAVVLMVAAAGSAIAGAGRLVQSGAPYKGAVPTMFVHPDSGGADFHAGTASFGATTNAEDVTVTASAMTYEGASQNWAGPLRVTRQGGQFWVVEFDFTECKAPVRTRKLTFVMKASRPGAPVIQKLIQFVQAGPAQ